MPKPVSTVVAVLIASLLGGPIVLDRCLVNCAGSRAAASATPACHHMGQPARHDWRPTTSCGHDHRPWSAIASGQVDIAAGLGVAVVPARRESLSLAFAAIDPLWTSPPARSLPPEFVRPLRI